MQVSAHQQKCVAANLLKVCMALQLCKWVSIYFKSVISCSCLLILDAVQYQKASHTVSIFYYAHTHTKIA